MLLIVGLGNPGKKYENTRHNLGFRVIDELQARLGADSFGKKFEGLAARASLSGRQMMLFKPQTFMNLSGLAVSAAATFYKADIRTELWVIHDDLDLPLGQLRIKRRGSAGGHRGVQSIIDRLADREFVRFRIGIGRPDDLTPPEDYVVRPFGAGEKEAAEAAVKRAAEAVILAVRKGVDRAMNLFNPGTAEGRGPEI